MAVARPGTACSHSSVPTAPTPRVLLAKKETKSARTDVLLGTLLTYREIKTVSCRSARSLCMAIGEQRAGWRGLAFPRVHPTWFPFRVSCSFPYNTL